MTRRLDALDASRRIGLAFVLGAGLLVAGCSTPRAGSPAPAPTPSSARTSPSAPAAPTVTKYAQTDLAQHPCDALNSYDRAALGIAGPGTVEGPSCHWILNNENVSLEPDAPESFAQTMTKNGRITQVPVGQHEAVQAEFQGICFVFVAVHSVDQLVNATAIPAQGGSQDDACPAAASVAAAALTHIQ
jgi:hypothetical protein